MQVENLADLGPERRAELLEREAGVGAVSEAVDEIIEEVRQAGDTAVRSLTAEHDDISVGHLEVTEDIDRASDEVDQEVLTAMRTAAQNIRSFHERQLRSDWLSEEDGCQLGRRFRPIERIGAYVPGGTAAYPSSALMTVIPAKVAGVEQVAVATPPGDPVNPVTLAALSIAGADEVYRVGGAQGVAALAYGTETIPAVDKLVGPGNRWVSAAKRQVQRDVPIDFVAGPSEVLILADTSAEPRYIAADLVAQAEHDDRASCVLLSTDEVVADEVAEALEEMLDSTAREDTARAALSHPGSGIFLCRSMSEAIAFTETYAPEHLSIQARDDEGILDRIDSAGSVFLGPSTPVAAGDYATGTNHVLPTNGMARATGGLSVDVFLRSGTVQRLSREAIKELAPTIETLARAEGLEAHARSVSIRTSQSK